MLHNPSPVRAAPSCPRSPRAGLYGAAGITAHHVVLKPPFVLDTAHVLHDADLVVVGNPTNPHLGAAPPRAALELRRPGRILVVDEAFADAIVG